MFINLSDFITYFYKYISKNYAHKYFTNNLTFDPIYSARLIDIMGCAQYFKSKKLEDCPELTAMMNSVSHDLLGLKFLFIKDAVKLNNHIKDLLFLFVKNNDAFKTFAKSFYKSRGLRIKDMKEICINYEDIFMIYGLRHFLPLIKKLISFSLKNATAILLTDRYKGYKGDEKVIYPNASKNIVKNFMQNIEINQHYTGNKVITLRDGPNPNYDPGSDYDSDYDSGYYSDDHVVAYYHQDEYLFFDLIDQILSESKHIQILKLNHLYNPYPVYRFIWKHIRTLYSCPFSITDDSDKICDHHFPNLESFILTDLDEHFHPVFKNITPQRHEPRSNPLLPELRTTDPKLRLPTYHEKLYIPENLHLMENLKKIAFYGEFVYKGHIDKSFYYNFINDFKLLESKLSTEVQLVICYDFNKDIICKTENPSIANPISDSSQINRPTHYKYRALGFMKHNYDKYYKFFEYILQNNFFNLRLTVNKYHSFSKLSIPHLEHSIQLNIQKLQQFTKDKEHKNKTKITELQKQLHHLQAKREQFMLGVKHLEEKTAKKWNNFFNNIYLHNKRIKTHLQEVLCILGAGFYLNTGFYERGILKIILEFMYNRKKIIFSLFDNLSYQKYCSDENNLHHKLNTFYDTKLDIFLDITSKNNKSLSLSSSIFLKNIYAIEKLFDSDYAFQEISPTHTSLVYLAIGSLSLIRNFIFLIEDVVGFTLREKCNILCDRYSSNDTPEEDDLDNDNSSSSLRQQPNVNEICKLAEKLSHCRIMNFFKKILTKWRFKGNNKVQNFINSLNNIIVSNCLTLRNKYSLPNKVSLINI